MDFRRNPVTCKASDVLLHGTGYCYAKSHLLAALLRANGISAGLCYQRLVLDERGPRLSYHGLNAVYLHRIRVVSRRSCAAISLASVPYFDPPVERLAFAVASPGEADLPGIYAEPIPAVVKVLLENTTYDQVYRNLPDIA